MGVPYLGSWSDSLPELGATIGHALPRILNPNLDQQNALKEMITKNPQLMDYYVNMEKTNPGSTAMFGKQAQQYFAGNELTQGFKDEQESQRVTTNINKQTLRAKTTENDQYDAYVEMLKPLQGTPEYTELMMEAAKNRVHGITAENMARGKLAIEALEDRREANDVAARLKDTPYEELYNQITSGKATPQDIGAIETHPKLEGFRLFYRTRQQAETQAAMDRRAAAREAAADGRLDRRLSVAAKKDADAQDAIIARELNTNNRLVDGMIRHVNTGRGKGRALKEEQAQSELERINTYLERNTQITGGPLKKAIWVEKGSGLFGAKKSGIVIVDASTMELDDTYNMSDLGVKPKTTSPGQILLEKAKQYKGPKEDIYNSPEFKALSPGEQMRVKTEIGN